MAGATLGLVVALGSACGPAPAGAPGVAPPPAPTSPGWRRRSLDPVATPAPRTGDSPVRLRPLRVAVDPERARGWVSLAGTERHPGGEVLEVDLAAGRVVGRIPVGRAPAGLALSAGGDRLLVVNRFSNFLSVIDTGRARVVEEIPVPFYCEDLVLDPRGARAFVSNFWKDQVLVVDLGAGAGPAPGLRNLGMGGSDFTGRVGETTRAVARCRRCGWRAPEFRTCPRCASGDVVREQVPGTRREADSIHALLRGRCGAAACHMLPRGGLVVGEDPAQALRSVRAHLAPGDPGASALLRAVTPIEVGGFEGRMDGRHHPGGTVFPDPEADPDFRRLRAWIAAGVEGPGIPVGSKPRDLALSPDGLRLYVANTGSLDVSVVDLETMRETDRIWVQSPVNDLTWLGDRLVLATLGVGSGHPGARSPAREAAVLPSAELVEQHRPWDGGWNRDWDAADSSVYRSPSEGSRFPMLQQDALGPFDMVDGTRQEGTRDIGSDLVLLDPEVRDVSRVARTAQFARYTSDSFEALAGDEKGEVPRELMQVVGAFPEQLAVNGDRLYVSMAGTFQVQEWTREGGPGAPPGLVPGRVFATGCGPAGLEASGETLVVADRLGDSLTLVDLGAGTTRRVALDPSAPAYPASDFERGEVVVQTSLFSVDQDQSCVHCHYRDTSDGKRWSNMATVGKGWQGDERFGGSREIPDLRTLTEKVPFLLEGIQTPYELVPQLKSLMPLVDLQGVTPAGDFREVVATPEDAARFPPCAANEIPPGERIQVAPGVPAADLLLRRERLLAELGRRYLGRAIDFDELVRLVGVYLEGENRLLPNPVEPDDPMVRQGRVLFESPEVGCAGCHPAPTFTDKVHAPGPNRAFPPVVRGAPRDGAVTLVSAGYIDRVRYHRHRPGEDPGRIEAREGHFVAPSLRGLWARPPSFLHHGHAVSLREVVCSPDHMALRRHPAERRDVARPGRWEIGKNEREGIPDTHGGTSHLSVWEIECLLAYLNSIE